MRITFTVTTPSAARGSITHDTTAQPIGSRFCLTTPRTLDCASSYAPSSCSRITSLSSSVTFSFTCAARVAHGRRGATRYNVAGMNRGKYTYEDTRSINK
jgi:hypothetical protein